MHGQRVYDGSVYLTIMLNREEKVMMEIPKKYIKVNIPLTERDYLSGNGEGV